MIVKITEEELKDIVQETVRDYLEHEKYFGILYGTDRKYITEGLTCTYSIGKLKSILYRKYDFSKLGIVWGELDMNPNSSNVIAPLTGMYNKTEDTDNWYFFTLELKYGIGDNKVVIKDIIHTSDACGWYLADMRYFTRDGNVQNIEVRNMDNVNFEDPTFVHTPLFLTFRAKFNAEYKKTSVPRYLYHIAPVRVLNKIRKQGLTPRSNGRISSHPDRVYLFVEYPYNWKEIADEFRKSGREEKYVLLKIDKEKLNKETKFYYDSNVMYSNIAIYTLEPIPANAIFAIERENNWKNV